jgi:hypothetical protein
LKLFNVGVNAAVFAAPAGEILCHRSDANPGDNGFVRAPELNSLNIRIDCAD